MNEEQFRSRIYWVTFLFSMLVVWVHSYNGELFLGLTGQAAVVDRIERAVGEQLGQMAVPGFFMVSAYLFYRRFTWEKLLYKWKSRVHSVLIPYFMEFSLLHGLRSGHPHTRDHPPDREDGGAL